MYQRHSGESSSEGSQLQQLAKTNEKHTHMMLKVAALEVEE